MKKNTVITIRVIMPVRNGSMIFYLLLLVIITQEKTAIKFSCNAPLPSIHKKPRLTGFLLSPN